MGSCTGPERDGTSLVIRNPCLPFIHLIIGSKPDNLCNILSSDDTSTNGFNQVRSVTYIRLVVCSWIIRAILVTSDGNLVKWIVHGSMVCTWYGSHGIVNASDFLIIQHVVTNSTTVFPTHLMWNGIDQRIISSMNTLVNDWVLIPRLLFPFNNITCNWCGHQNDSIFRSYSEPTIFA